MRHGTIWTFTYMYMALHCRASTSPAAHCVTCVCVCMCVYIKHKLPYVWQTSKICCDKHGEKFYDIFTIFRNISSTLNAKKEMQRKQTSDAQAKIKQREKRLLFFDGEQGRARRGEARKWKIVKNFSMLKKFRMLHCAAINLSRKIAKENFIYCCQVWAASCCCCCCWSCDESMAGQGW